MLRQHDDKEAQLLARKLGQPVMPAWISIYDDPLLARLRGRTLGGA